MPEVRRNGKGFRFPFSDSSIWVRTILDDIPQGMYFGAFSMRS